MHNNVNAAIIGTGGFYEKHKSTINRNFNITVVFDSDETKQGYEIDGFVVIKPEFILDYSFDVIIVMSDFVIEIKEQLLILGVPHEKIIKGRDLVKLSEDNILNFVQSKVSTSSRILLACMQKSGSTYMAALFASLPAFSQESFVPSYGGREQEICEYTIHKLLTPEKNIIAQHHVRYSTGTESIINTFDLKVIVLVRNIFDVILSTYDHCINESTIFPMATIPNDFSLWEKEKAYEFIVDMIIPWYFNFYVSWVTCGMENNIVFISFDDLMQNKSLRMNDICRELKVDVSELDIDIAFEALKTKKTRKNVGITGRGSMLSEHLKDKVRMMCSYYSDVDFSPIGL